MNDADDAASEVSFRHMVSAVTDYAIFALDRRGRILSWNLGARRLKGYEADEVIGTQFSRFYSPAEIAAGHPEHVLALAAGNGRYEEEGWRYRKDGSAFWAHVVITALIGDDGQVRGFTKVTRDLSERRAADLQLREATVRLEQAVQARTAELEAIRHELQLALDASRSDEQLLRSLANSIPQLVWIADEHGDISWYNSKWYELTGTTPETMRGWGWQAVHDPRVLPEVIARWRSSLTSGTPFEMTFPLRTADGTFRTFLTRVLPVKDAQGAVVRWFGTNTDIEDLEHARAALEASEARLTLATDAGQMGTWSFDPVTGQVECSASLARLFDFAPDAIPGEIRAFWDRIEPDDREAVAAALQRWFLADEPDDIEFRIATATGVRWLASRGLARRARNDDRVRIFGVTYDITERKHAAAALGNASDDLRRALHAREEFLSIASHELKTPLTSLRLQIQLLELDLERDAEAALSRTRLRDLTARMMQPLDRLQRSVDAMFDITRMRSHTLELSLEPVDLTELVRDTVERLAPQFRAAGAEPPVLGASRSISGRWDRSRIEQVLTNVLINALRYGKKQPVSIAVDGTDTIARCTVADHGIGIAPENLERIFERFQRAVDKSSASGLGLGLYIARQIVTAHGGRIWARTSALERGTTFVIELPRTPAL